MSIQTYIYINRHIDRDTIDDETRKGSQKGRLQTATDATNFSCKLERVQWALLYIL